MQGLIGGLYHPVPELGNNKKLRPYFPDGSWCHEEGGVAHFCRKTHCEPAGLGRRGARGVQAPPKIPILQMASPDDGELDVPVKVQNYFMGKGAQPPPPPIDDKFGHDKGVEFELD
jgi:hypothetical protein